jgi:hypothetical protein
MGLLTCGDGYAFGTDGELEDLADDDPACRALGAVVLLADEIE